MYSPPLPHPHPHLPQEIEATTFDEDGEAVTPTGLGLPPQTGAGDSGSNGSDGEGSQHSPPGSVGSSEHSLTSPNTPVHSSLPSLGSPASVASPSTPGEQGDWGGGYRAPPYSRGNPRAPVGSDPRDSNNPLSISSLTSR